MKMKLDKGAILASMAIIMVASVFAGAGTMAWFSTENESTGPYTLNTANMDMSIQTVMYTFDNLVPGQEFGPITIKIVNDGDMDIRFLCGSMVLGGSKALADKIEIVEWHEYIPGYGWIDNLGKDFAAPEQHFEELVKDGSSPLTLLELAKSYSVGRGEPWSKGVGIDDQFGYSKKYASDWVTGWGYDEVPEGRPAILKGATEYQMYFEFKFSETAGNNLQEKSVTFTITFLGMQDLSQRP